MKNKILLVLLIGLLAGCKSSTGPTSSNNIIAVLPQNGSTFTYAYGPPPNPQLTEQVTIIDTTGSEFWADLVSDTIGGSSATGNSLVLILADGDLKILTIDTLTLPIATHTSYTESPVSVPIKINGYVGNGTIYSHSDYLGEDTIYAAGQYFPCSVVTRTDSASFIFPNHDSLNYTTYDLTTYSYSSQIGYFVEEIDDVAYIVDSLNTANKQILTAYKLGK